MKPTLHQYHCVLCGTQLIEGSLGILYCKNCETEFVPSMDAEEKECRLSWIPEPDQP